ncbi:MAG: hypothetical protein LAO20_13310 [Acidobacteriia bacterium]|nr:hypothetical protein [Terriglobia bacterium]
MTAESGRLVDAWINRYEIIEQKGDEAPEAKALFWSYMEVDELCGEDPDRALHLITNILASTQNEYVLANLAAGPLETLLTRHGKKLIGKVEYLAKADPRFQHLLQNVWQNRIDDQTWGRVLRAAKG